nr:PqiC family protein [uncultured Pseudomonas sp.]
MTIRQSIFLAIVLLVLAACRGDPIHFYTLSPIQTTAAEQESDVEVQIEAISVPPQVDRQQIVIRNSDSSLTILDSHWWGASLSDELRSALAQQLPNNRDGRKLSVRLDVHRLDSIPGQYAFIDVTWRLREMGPGKKTIVNCRSTLRTPSGVSMNEIVIAHQHNLKRLAEDIKQGALRTPMQCD